MKNDFEPLQGLLRAEMTAVHQQFFHMLALRQWQQRDILKRVTEVDTLDFRNAMAIIEVLVADGVPVSLPAHAFRPGGDVDSMLLAELDMERRLAAVIDSAAPATGEARRLVARAAAPRKEYRLWLEGEIASRQSRKSEYETGEALADLLAQLIGLLEQAMLHAFAWRKAGRHEAADNAWRLSGAAMLYATALVKRAVLDGTMPTPATCPAVRMATDIDAGFAADIALVRQCAAAGRLATAAEGDTALGRLCLAIAADCDRVAVMQPDGAFPAELGRSKVFDDFAATVEKHVAQPVGH